MKKSLSWSGKIVAVMLWVLLMPVCSSAAGPGPLIDYAISFFPPAGAVILHGGWSEATGWQPSSDTWKLDSSGWSLLNATNSPHFSHHSMTYDSTRQVLVMCGRTFGASPTYQTWEYNGTQWTQGPDISIGFDGDVEVAFDAARNETVLYAAPYPFPTATGNSETWGYNGLQWTRKTPAQLPVSAGDGAMLQYDAVHQNVVLVGAVGFGQAAATETWVWNGVDWRPVTGPQPPNALTAGMAFDGVRGEMVLVTTEMQTWTFDGTAWTRRSPTPSPSPAPNAFFSMAFDSLRQVAVFHGGESIASSASTPVYPATTWQWNGTDWAEFTPGGILPAYAVLGSDFAISMASINVQGGCYGARFNYYPHPQDPSHIYWMLDLSSLGTSGNCGVESPLLDLQTLAISVPMIDVFGAFFTVELAFYSNPGDLGGLYWQLASAGAR